MMGEVLAWCLFLYHLELAIMWLTGGREMVLVIGNKQGHANRGYAEFEGTSHGNFRAVTAAVGRRMGFGPWEKKERLNGFRI